MQSNTAKLSVEGAWIEGVATATGALANLAQSERCIGLSKSGDLWIWNTSNRELSRKNQQGATVPLRANIERLELARDVPGNPGFKDTPYDVSVLEHSDGNLYVAEVYSGGNGIINTIWGMGGRIHRVVQNGETTLIYNSESGPTRITPHAIAEGLDGSIYILNFNSGAIFEISATGVLKKFADTLTPPDQDIPAIFDYRKSYRSMAICSGEIFVSFSETPIQGASVQHDYRITPARVIESISFGSRGVLGLASHGEQLYLLTRKSFGFSWLQRRNADGSVQDIAGGFGGEVRLLGVAPDGRVLLGEIGISPGSEFKYGKYLIITPPKQ
ncbi:NHL repeat-containing protein [Acidovorax sp. Q11]